MKHFSANMHRFVLGTARTVCPGCGRRDFKPYIDSATGLPVDEAACGRCNREVKCGYHLSPREYFSATGRSLELLKRDALMANRRLAPTTAVDFVAPELARRTMRFYTINPLHRFMLTKFEAGVVDEAFSIYSVGTAARFGGSTIFWYRDLNGRYRSGKVMAYDPLTGHRRKDIQGFNWVHALLRMRDVEFHYAGCLFGTHLVRGYRRVMVVESEKTALALWMAMREAGVHGILPVATGGKSNIKPDLDRPHSRWKPFKGKELILAPDADSFTSWSAAGLESVGSGVFYIKPDWLGLDGSEDIADAILGDAKEYVKNFIKQL